MKRCEMTNTLKTEIDFFEQNRKEWCEHHLGKIAVIHGITLHGFYDTYNTALRVGYDKCGTNTPFLIKEVLYEDRIEWNSRLFNVDLSFLRKNND